MKSLAATFVAALLVLAAFTSSSSEANQPEKIKIGVLAPLSGPAAELGVKIQHGIELAREELKSNIEIIYGQKR